MGRNISEMTDREILEELLRDKRKNDILNYIQLGLYFVLFLFIFYVYQKYAPIVREFYASYQSFVNEFDQIKQQFDSISKTVNDFSNSFNPETLKNLEEASEKLAKIFKYLGM